MLNARNVGYVRGRVGYRRCGDGRARRRIPGRLSGAMARSAWVTCSGLGQCSPWTHRGVLCLWGLCLVVLARVRQRVQVAHEARVDFVVSAALALGALGHGDLDALAWLRCASRICRHVSRSRVVTGGHGSRYIVFMGSVRRADAMAIRADQPIGNLWRPRD